MAHAFKLTAKRNICKKNSSTVVLAKGMTIEHIERDCSAPGASNVCKTIQQKLGVEVIVTTGSLYFDIEKLS